MRLAAGCLHWEVTLQCQVSNDPLATQRSGLLGDRALLHLNLAQHGNDAGGDLGAWLEVRSPAQEKAKRTLRRDGITDNGQGAPLHPVGVEARLYIRVWVRENQFRQGEHVLVLEGLDRLLG